MHFSIPKRAKTDQEEVSIAAKTDLIGISHDAQARREMEEKEAIDLSTSHGLVCHVQVDGRGRRRFISIYSNLGRGSVH